MTRTTHAVHRRRPGRWSTAAVLGVVLLAGCAQPLPEPSPDPAPAAPPAAVVPSQVEDVLAAVSDAIEAADAEQSLGPAAERVTGPAATLRTAEYALAAGTDAEVTPVPEGTQTIVTTATDTWPRMIVVVTEAPEDLRAPLLLTLVQDGPREQYRLWSWVRLFPGTQMPPTSQPEVGNAPVPMDSTEVLVPPGELMDRYVDVLVDGDDSPHVGTFGADPLRENLAGLRDAYAQSAANGGAVTESIEPLEEGPVAVGTADGGAIVTGGFRLTISITLEDSTLTVDPATAAFLDGETTLSSSLELTFVGTVAFAVPPVGGEEQVTLLGGEFSLTGATGA